MEIIVKKRMSKLSFISSSLFGLFFVKSVSAASFDNKIFDQIFSISSKESKGKSAQSNTSASFDFSFFNAFSNNSNNTIPQFDYGVKSLSSNFADLFNFSTTNKVVSAPVNTTASLGFADIFNFSNTINTSAAVSAPVNTSASLSFADLFTTSNTINTPVAAPAPVNTAASLGFADLFTFNTAVRETEQDRVAVQNRLAEAERVRIRIETEELLRQNEMPLAAEREEDARINLEILHREEARIAAEPLAAQEAERAPINAFLAQNLENGRSFNGEIHKTLIQTPEYQGISNLYFGSEYPKIPRFHPYHPQVNHTYLSLEIPKTFFSNDHLHQIFGNIPDENINIFLLAQDNSENNILFRPHYYIDSDIPDGDLAYNSNKEVSVSIFNLGDTPGTFKDGAGNNVEEGIFFRSAISTHPGNLGDQQPDGTFVPDIPALVASPNNFPIDGFIKQQGALLASVVTGPAIDGTQKGALTIHYFPSQENDNEIGWPNNDTLNNRIAIANTVEEGLRALEIDPDLDFGDIENFKFCVQEIARIIQNVRHDRDEE